MDRWGIKVRMGEQGYMDGWWVGKWEEGREGGREGRWVCRKCLSHTCVHAKSLQMCLTLLDPEDCSLPGSSVWGFSGQEHWSGLPCPPPRYVPDPGVEPASL